MNMMTNMEPPRDSPRARLSRRRKLLDAQTAATTARFDKLGELFSAFDRDDMEAGVDLLLAALDGLDGDPDVEPNGDELDGCMGEDDFHLMTDPAGFPGCPVSDPGGGDANDEAADPTWIEWQTRGRHKFDRFGGEIMHRNPFGSICDDDEEDDDPLEANGDESDTNDGEDDVLTAFSRHWLGTGPGCPIADPGGCEHDGREPTETGE